jgi:tetratricopeptide (TPR) repeat protein
MTEREQIMDLYEAAQRLMRMNRYREAARYLAVCYDRCEEAGDEASCETILGELAGCYQKAECYSASLDTLMRLMERLRAEGPTARRALIHHNMGIIHECCRDYDQAREQFRLAAEVSGEAGNLRGQGISLAMLGRVEIDSGLVSAGFRSLFTALHLLHESAADEFGEVARFARQACHDLRGGGRFDALCAEHVTDADLRRLILDA